jgi:signal transduction histidine kinase
MSTHAARTLPRARPAPRAYAIAGLVAAGAGATTASVWTVSRSSVLVDAQSVGILHGILIASWIVAGSYMWWQRPGNRLGLLVAGAGFVYASTSLMASGDGFVYTVGRVFLAIFLVYYAYVYLCFPGDRLVAYRDRRFIGGLALATAVVWPFVLVFADRLPGGGPLTECGSRCPDNALRVASVPGGFSDFLNGAVDVLTGAALLGIAAFLVAKARSPARLRRRAVEPVMYAFGVQVAAYVANTIVNPTGGALQAARLTTAVGALLVPVAMLAGQARGRWFASATLTQLVSRGRGERVTPRRIQEWLRDALGDPTLDVALWDRVRSRFVDVEGNAVDVTTATPGRAVTPVIHDGRPVAALEHSASLGDASGVVEGLAETALILLENTQLVDELRASRARIVASADQERHRLERDLHDGAQQRLFLLQTKLARLRQGVEDAELAGKLEEIQDDAATALEELRVLAHGIYPTVLVESGIPEALRAFAVAASIPIQVTDHWIGRCSPTIEAALYFCGLEAIQNAAKHAGAGARVTIELDRDGDRIDFSVTDDGVGFQAGGTSDGIGFVTMRDRISAVGGELEVLSEPGAGVTVHVSIADAPLRDHSEQNEAMRWRSE